VTLPDSPRAAHAGAVWRHAAVAAEEVVVVVVVVVGVPHHLDLGVSGGQADASIDVV